MLVKPKIGFKYDCRHCDRSVSGETAIFSMIGKRTVIRCQCGESALVAYVLSGRLIVEYPCSICGTRHRGSAALREILQTGAVTFRCPITDSPALTAGRPEKLQTENEERMLHAALGKTDEIVPTPSDILCTAQELAARGRIACRCGASRFRASHENGLLEFSCTSCGARARFSVRSMAELRTLQKMRILISKDGKA